VSRLVEKVVVRGLPRLGSALGFEGVVNLRSTEDSVWLFNAENTAAPDATTRAIRRNEVGWHPVDEFHQRGWDG
jgi:hypothetical protein